MNLKEKEEARQADLEIARKMAELKKSFKNLSKNQLIHLLLQQIALLAEHQNINKVLLERNKGLEAAQGGKSEK